MPRRVSLPGADELFRAQAEPPMPDVPAPAPPPPMKVPAGPTGRIRHDEKITVYVSTEELLNLEQIRLRLRAEYGINVDRGRLVRVAIGMLADELQTGGDDSAALQRLQQ